MSVSGYWRLSLVYVCYFAVLGALLPYWPVYLKGLGFGAADIGLLLALPQATKLVAPNLWGWLADATGRRRAIVLLGALCSALIFTAGATAHSFAGLAVLLLGFSFFWNALLPQYEVLTLEWLGRNSHYYPRVRLWGSIGFILVVLGLGELFAVAALGWLPWVMVALLWVLLFSSLGLPGDAGSRQAVSGAPSRRVAWQQPALLFFTAFLMQVSHGPYYTFYSIDLAGLGYGTTAISLLWCLGVAAEISLFLVLHRWLAGGRFVRILRISLLLAALRWVLIGTLAANFTWLIVAQLLHAASFASFHAACVSWVQAHFGKAKAGLGQGLYSSVAIGAGWAVGAWGAGLAWARWEAGSFLLAAAVALAGLVVTVWLRDVPRSGGDGNGL